MNNLRKAWTTFRQLKTWIQVIIVLVILGIFGAISGNGSSTSSSKSASDQNATASASSSVSPTPMKTEPAVSPAEFKSALSHMRITNDDVRNTRYYRDVTSPGYVNINGFDIYAGGAKGAVPNLYLEIQYEGSDWLFIKSYFFNVDGETFEISPDYGTIKTDNDTNVWEWYNEPMTSENVDLIQKIIESKKTVMRLNGSQYYKDVTITQTQKMALQHVLTVFQGLGGDLATV
jgi:hypothetical protein